MLHRRGKSLCTKAGAPVLCRSSRSCSRISETGRSMVLWATVQALAAQCRLFLQGLSQSAQDHVINMTKFSGIWEDAAFSTWEFGHPRALHLNPLRCSSSMHLHYASRRMEGCGDQCEAPCKDYGTRSCHAVLWMLCYVSSCAHINNIQYIAASKVPTAG